MVTSLRQFGLRPLLVLALCPWAAAAWSQAPAQPGSAIYSCIDDKGRRITADRPIAACIDREQQVLNRDGSLRTILPPGPLPFTWPRSMPFSLATRQASGDALMRPSPPGASSSGSG